MLRSALRKNGQTPHICIVGAGIAGLRCADVLLKKNFKITILEGRDRIGGRVYQNHALGTPLDMGANWVHGTENNPIADIAIETKSMSKEPQDSHDGQSVFDSEGRLIEKSLGNRYSEKMWSVIEEAFAYSTKNGASIDSRTSLYDFFVEKAAELDSKEGALKSEAPNGHMLDQPSLNQLTLLQVAELWGAYVGDDVRRQSLKYFWLEEVIDGENVFLTSSYSKILAHIARPALEKADIRFNTVVTSIISPSPNSLTQKVALYTSSTPPLEFDDVVLTCPLGWLKRNTRAFTPPLPSPLEKAILGIGYGRLEKCYIGFSQPWWRKSDPESTEPEKSQLASSIQWLSPSYAPETNPERWSIQAMDLSALPPPPSPPSNTSTPGPEPNATILFYTTGACSTYLVSTTAPLSPEERTAFLLSFFRPYIALLPHYSPHNPACKPTGVLATAWSADDLAGNGSYSNFPVGLEKGDELIERMREGMPQRRVWLAGEHTSPFVALGTVTGAWWAGEGVAERIGEAYGGNVE
ncbi:MAG: hypothetical protein M1824_006606 [Vezdaea acicularis]|nr:MAG: hypothetical protein M1824_006606 [Vezdaea acicularis]